MHLMYDGYVKRTLTKDEAEQLTLELIRTVDMTPVGPFCWQEFDALGPSFFQMIAESHVFGHYYNLDGRPPYLSMEIYSCKPFRVVGAQNFIRDRFGIWECRYKNLLDRSFPPLP